MKTRRAPSRHIRDARVYGHTTTAMHKLNTRPPCSRIPCNTLHYYHTPCSLAGVWSHSLVIKDIACHTSSASHPLSPGRVCSHSRATDVPLAHPRSISQLLVSRTPAAGLLRMVLITGGTLDTTPPYKAIPIMIFSKVKKLSPGCAFIRVIRRWQYLPDMCIYIYLICAYIFT